MLSSLIKRHHYRQLEKARDAVRPAQERILRNLIRCNRNTPFGRAHQFSSMRSLEDYRNAVPVRTSTGYAPFLQKVYEADPHYLTRETPMFFAMTAGSTGDYKYIPITPSFKRAINRAVFAFYHLFESQCPELGQDPIQFLVGSAEGGQAPVGIPQGFVSGFNYRNLPAFIRRKFIIPYWVFTLEDAGDRYYAMGRFLAANERVAAIGAFSPMNIGNILDAVRARPDTFINDLLNGTLTLTKSKGEDCSLPPQKVLAQRMTQWQQQDGSPVSLANMLFPNLRYYACWLGGNMGHARDILFQHMGEKPVFEMPFSASEGVFAVPHRLNAAGGIAAVTSHFLEYIREQDIDDPNAPTRCAWELEKGQTYYQIVSSQAGLYRYNMEDLIQVTDYWGQIPVVEFIAKKARQISIANERLNEHDVTEACRVACARSGARLREFVLFPSRQGFYELVVDGEFPDSQNFADAVEQALCELAKGYGFEREDRLLKPLRVLPVLDDSLRHFVHQQQFRSTLPSAQFKPVHLSNEFEGARRFTTYQVITAQDRYAVNHLQPVLP